MTEMATSADILWMVTDGKCLVNPARGACTQACELFETAVVTFDGELEKARVEKNRSLTLGEAEIPLTAQEAVGIARVVRNTIQQSQGVPGAKFDQACARSTTVMN